MFSFEGKAFRADTLRGLAYCDLRAAGRNPAVEFDFIGLQYGYEIPFADLPEDEPTEMNRTIGCAGGRVKFICIDRPRGHPCNTMVRLPERGLLWKELWEQVAGRVLRYRDDVEPLYPVLMPDDTLCLVLQDVRPWRRTTVETPVEVDRICRFDMRSKRPLWHGISHDRHVAWPIILPGDFFTKCRPPPKNPRESRLPARKRRRHASW
ncbi:hypothetical protein GQ55_9G052100 [Panicum hallii var. hallii]|uniref:DUF1618 domain-containing protein n=1 Tax=Panicum hallii var. hallii TaxID=1504633 RepID=A0A2T7BZU3_9POAL|nr:hypothetical protein GQ55_9G052100 [Panicum hallii var. hallii]